VVKTDGLKCPEMREGRAWRHHIDYYGIAATAYLLLFGTYMEVIKVSSLIQFFCGSGMLSRILIFVHLGSRIQKHQHKRGVKNNLLSYLFL
jgi:hypothetical protein